MYLKFSYFLKPVCTRRCEIFNAIFFHRDFRLFSTFATPRFFLTHGCIIFFNALEKIFSNRYRNNDEITSRIYQCKNDVPPFLNDFQYSRTFSKEFRRSTMRAGAFFLFSVRRNIATNFDDFFYILYSILLFSPIFVEIFFFTTRCCFDIYIYILYITRDGNAYICS